MELFLTHMIEATKVIQIFWNPNILLPALAAGVISTLLIWVFSLYQNRKNMETETHTHGNIALPSTEGIDIQMYPRLTPFQTVDNLLTTEEKAFLHSTVGSILCSACGHLMVFHYTRGDCRVCRCPANDNIIGG